MLHMAPSALFEAKHKQESGTEIDASNVRKTQNSGMRSGLLGLESGALVGSDSARKAPGDPSVPESAPPIVSCYHIIKFKSWKFK